MCYTDQQRGLWDGLAIRPTETFPPLAFLRGGCHDVAGTGSVGPVVVRCGCRAGLYLLVVAGLGDLAGKLPLNGCFLGGRDCPPCPARTARAPVARAPGR